MAIYVRGRASSLGACHSIVSCWRSRERRQVRTLARAETGRRGALLPSPDVMLQAHYLGSSCAGVCQR